MRYFQASFQELLVVAQVLQAWTVTALDVFAPIAQDKAETAHLTSYPGRYPPFNLDARYKQLSLPIQTNKFYSQLLLSPNGADPVYSMPYVHFWHKSARRTWCVGYTDRANLVYGPPADKDVKYFFAPPLQCALGLGAVEMTDKQVMTVTDMDLSSAHVSWTPGDSANKASMNTTVSQGGAFVTMYYDGLQPTIFSANATFVNFEKADFAPSLQGSAVRQVSKFKVTTNATETWLVYVFDTNSAGSTPNTEFTMPLNSASSKHRRRQHTHHHESATGVTEIIGPANFHGYVQVVRLPGAVVSKHQSTKHGKRMTTEKRNQQAAAAATAETVYDEHAGTFSSGLALSAAIESEKAATGRYTLDMKPTKLLGKELLTFLYPHQQDSIDESSGTWANLDMWSITKGSMKARIGNPLTFQETDLPVDYGLLTPLPYLDQLSPSVINLIRDVAKKELTQDIAKLTNQDKLYFSGKALAKFAQICLVLKEVVKDQDASCIQTVEAQLDNFIQGKSLSHLVYDNVWKGVISGCGVGKDDLTFHDCDFGNAMYNDHHFQLSYFVQAAATLAQIDASWLERGFNKKFINMLIRDFANPSETDTFAPPFRSFDWFGGLSIARGIMSDPDGKDQESSSEDYNALFAVKLWGTVIKDTAMVARTNLMLALMRRSVQSYYLLTSENKVQPAKYLHNLVTGILFENKIAFTTWFGNNPEYIYGIQMLPSTALSPYFRSQTFVRQQYKAVKNVFAKVNSGWQGIFMADLRIIDAKASFDYFANKQLTDAFIDDGASRAMYLTLAAGNGGAQAYQAESDAKADGKGMDASGSIATILG